MSCGSCFLKNTAASSMFPQPMEDRGHRALFSTLAAKTRCRKLYQSITLEFAETGVRINVVAPGPIETGMLNRFTGTAQKKAALISGVPIKRIGHPKEVAA